MLIPVLFGYRVLKNGFSVSMLAPIVIFYILNMISGLLLPKEKRKLPKVEELPKVEKLPKNELSNGGWGSDGLSTYNSGVEFTNLI